MSEPAASVDHELAVIGAAIERAVHEARGEPEATGRKIVIEIPLARDGTPQSAGTKIMPPWWIIGRRDLRGLTGGGG